MEKETYQCLLICRPEVDGTALSKYSVRQSAHYPKLSCRVRLAAPIFFTNPAHFA
jgi:hypothetical protein